MPGPLSWVMASISVYEMKLALAWPLELESKKKKIRPWFCMFRHNKYIGKLDNSNNIYSHLMVINVINNTILKGVSLLFF